MKMKSLMSRLAVFATAVALAACDGNVNDGTVIIAVTSRASVGSGGIQSVFTSQEAGISADGRYVVFSSDSDNLVAGDANGARDVFRYDLVADTVILISVTPGNASGNGNSDGPSISDDGNLVAFHSFADDLTVDTDGNFSRDVFVRDIAAGTTTLVSAIPGVPPLTAGDMASFDPDVSGNGQFIAYSSAATDLVAGDGNGLEDIFRYEIATGTNIRVNLDFLGNESGGSSLLDVFGLPPGSSGKASISADGNFVAFESGAEALVVLDNPSLFRDVFIRDVNGATTTRVGDLSFPAGNSRFPSISADGQLVAFTSDAGNLIPVDSNGRDIFLHDSAAPLAIELITLNSDGIQAVDSSEFPSISADGRFVAFESQAANLVLGDTNQSSDIFVRDRATGTVVRASVSTNGFQTEVFELSMVPAISADGRWVAFTSTSSTLVNGDTNGQTDVFVRGPLH